MSKSFPKPILLRARWALSAVSSTLFFCSITAWGAPGVVLDGSFGASGALPGPNFLITAGMGRQVGSNLFHSFSDFNLTSGQSATFTGPAQIQNIIARVTGGNPSSIDGAINSDIAGANLFFLNPSGVMFGAHAQVNVSGAFTVGTPDYVKLADGGKFNTSLGGSDNLTSASVSAFGFLAARPSAVQMTGSTLRVHSGQGLQVIAGDVTLNDTELDAPSGKLTIFSAASPGVIPFSLATAGSGYASATNPTFGTISILNGSYVDIDGAGGGNMVLRGGNVTVNDSTVSSVNSGSAAGGNISLQASIQISVQAGAIVQSGADSTGNAGNISLQTGGLAVDGTGSSGDTFIQNFSDAGALGSAGSLTILATGAVTLANGGGLVTITNNSGGQILLQADSLDINGSGAAPGLSTLISAVTYGNTPGNGGLVSLHVAHEISLEGGGFIVGSTNSVSDSAAIEVNAGSLDIDGSGNFSFTGIASQSEGAGNAGPLTVNVAGLLTLSNGAQIEAASYASGGSGNLLVHAGSAELLGSDAFSASTGIQTIVEGPENGGLLTLNVDGLLAIDGNAEVSSQTYSSGNGGNINVHAGSIQIANSGSPDGTGIESNTFDEGNAGSINVQANSLDIAGSLPAILTGISDQALSGSNGNGGSVAVNVLDGLTIENYGVITTNTFSSGNGGAIRVQAGSLAINSAGPSQGGLTGIGANASAGSTGDGGALTVSVKGSATLTGDPAQITTETFSSGNAGFLTVNVNGALRITNGAGIAGGTTSSGSSNGVLVHAGSIYINSHGYGVDLTGIGDTSQLGATGNAGPLTVEVDNALVMADGGEISSGAFSAGNAGTVTVNAGSLTIENGGRNSVLTGIASETDGDDADGYATGEGGNAGSVNVTVRGVLSIADCGEIDTDTFSLGNAGAVTVHAGSLTIDGTADPDGFTGISSSSEGFAGSIAGGNAGLVTVTVSGKLSLLGGGEITGETATLGAGGDVSVQAGSLTVASVAGITSETVGTYDDEGNFTDLGGNAGAVHVSVDGGLTITGGGFISTDTFCLGNAGDVTVRCGSLGIDNSAHSRTATGIFSDSVSYTGASTYPGGKAGSIGVAVTGALSLTAGGEIAAESFTTGQGGDVGVQAGSVDIDGTFSGISAFGVNEGGSVTVGGGNVTLEQGGGIEAASTYGNGGSVVVNASSNLTLQSGSFISTQAALDGGNVTLNVGALVYLLDSRITAASGRNGGNIVIDPEFVVLNDSLISANAAVGEGGNITINSNFFFDMDSLIMATGSTTDGTITITAPNFDLANNLLILPGDLVQAEKELRERCARSLNHEFSSLIVVGRGGVETPPDELQPDFGIDPLAGPPR